MKLVDRRIREGLDNFSCHELGTLAEFIQVPSGNLT